MLFSDGNSLFTCQSGDTARIQRRIGIFLRFGKLTKKGQKFLYGLRIELLRKRYYITTIIKNTNSRGKSYDYND